MDCSHCGSTFNNFSSLNNHQKTAKYCLKIQSKDNERFRCSVCRFSFSSKQRLDTHTCKKQDVEERLDTSCTLVSTLIAKIATLNTATATLKSENVTLKTENVTLKTENVTLKTENVTLKTDTMALKTENAALNAENDVLKGMSKDAIDCIHEIAKRPAKTVNNTKMVVMNPLNLSPSKVKDVIGSCFTDYHFFDGQKGVARFTVDKLLTDSDGVLNYVCTDPSRHIYKYKTHGGDLERDLKAKKLTDIISKDILHKSSQIVANHIDGDPDQFMAVSANYQDIRSIQDDNTGFRSELANLTAV